MVPIILLISNPSSLFSKPLGSVPSLPTTTGTTIIFMFLLFFSSLAWSNIWLFSPLFFKKTLDPLTLLCIIAYFLKAVIFLSLISSSSSPFSSFLSIVPRAPTIIGDTGTFMCFRILTSLPKSRHLSGFRHYFHLWSEFTAKFMMWQVFFFFINTRLSLLFWIGYSVSV